MLLRIVGAVAFTTTAAASAPPPPPHQSTHPPPPHRSTHPPPPQQPAAATTFQARGKWFTAAVSLPDEDALRVAGGDATLFDHNLDLRLMWQGDRGPWRMVIHHATTAIAGDSAPRGATPGLVLAQTPSGDADRLVDWAWELAEGGDARLLHRFDRLAVSYRTPRWGVTIGRQAVSWGAGLVFQPMDLLTPFAPTSVDQDYKAGDDMVLIERLFEGGGDLQVLAVGRRGQDGRADWTASSVAAKFRGGVGELAFDVLAAHHRGGRVFGLGWRAPVGGALVRSDVVWASQDGGTAVSGILNVDGSVAAFGTVLHLFGEYHRNGFGVRRLPADGHAPARHPHNPALPAALHERLARREVFTLMRDYLAFGVSFRWHMLVQQTASVIANLADGSLVLQAAVTVDVSEASRWHFGFAKPFGGVGDEFGRMVVAPRATSGGGSRAFVRLARYF